jgi:hypothetical protein
MSTNLVRALFIVPVAVLLMGAAKLVDPPPIDTPVSLSQKEIQNVVRRTLITRGWLLTKDSGNEMAATLTVRTHVVKLKFVVADQKIHVSYVDSANMDYAVNAKGVQTIHRKYPGWVSNLTQAFHREMQLAALAKSN